MEYKTGDTITIQVGEHIFIPPPIPQKKEILFYDLPKAEQYWKRPTDFPATFTKWHREVLEDSEHTIWEGRNLKELSIEDTTVLIEYRDRELQRMRNGIWFMNRGNPTYITGAHYFALTHGAMFDSKNDVELKSKYGKYMRFQRDYCYFIEIIKATKLARGGNVVKPKKTGITQLQCLIILCDAILSKNAIYRMMSTKEDVAKDTNFKYIAYAMQELPPILTPSVSNQNMGEILFGPPAGARGRRNKRMDEDLEYLNTWITTVPTVKNAFDSQTNRVAWIDEESKIKEAMPKETHDITIATVMQGLDRYGYVIYTHYVSETNDKSFSEARKIYYESKIKTVNEQTGQTASKLLCFALTALDGIFGACDKYGEPLIEQIKAEIKGEHEARKDDPSKLQSYKRQMPECEDDCWQIGAGENSIFDNIRLGIKDKSLEIDESSGVFAYEDFNFEWTIKPTCDEVKEEYKFPGVPRIVKVSDEDKIKGKAHGNFKWYRKELTPDWWLKKHINNLGKDKKGKLQPRSDSPFYISIDPTGMSDKKDVVTASKNAIHVFLLPNGELDGYFERSVSNKRLMVSYLFRPNNPMDTLFHAIQAIMFFGCYVLVEGNASWLFNRLKKWGFGNFLIVLNKDGAMEPYSGYEGQKPFTSQTTTIDQYVNAGKVHLGIPEMDIDIDHMDNLDDRDVISDLMQFDPKDTRRFDAGVCYLLGLLGISQHLGWRQKKNERAQRIGDGTIRQAAMTILG